MKADSLKITLLSGAATLALLTADPAMAQMYSTAPGFYLSLEGRYVMNRGDKLADIGAASATPIIAPLVGVDARADKGWGGKAMLGYRFGNNWDVGFGFSGAWLKGRARKSSNGSGTMSTYNGRIQNTVTSVAEKIKVKLNYQVADFEAGYNWKMGAASNVRLFGGLRLAHFNQTAKATIDASQTQTVGPINNTFTSHRSGTRKTTFLGGGPRLGVNGQLGLGVGGFNVFGGVSGALLVGRYKDKHSFSVVTPATTTGSSSKDKSKTKLVPNAEGEIGIGYNFTTGGNTTLGLQLGYRGEGWWGVSSDAPVLATGKATHASDQFMHGPFVRLVATFGAAAPAPVASPPPPAPPLDVARKGYIVFFDFDKSNITAEAQKTINDAVAAAKAGNSSRVTLTGHTDRSGSEQYNMALSLRRAEAVKAVMIRQGVPASAIFIIGRGETQPLVPTADGVREPQNRRVEILI